MPRRNKHKLVNFHTAIHKIDEGKILFYGYGDRYGYYYSELTKEFFDRTIKSDVRKFYPPKSYNLCKDDLIVVMTEYNVSQQHLMLVALDLPLPPKSPKKSSKISEKLLKISFKSEKPDELNPLPLTPA